MDFSNDLVILSGPILRKVSCRQMTIWLATSQPVDIQLELKVGEQAVQSYLLTDPTKPYCQTISAAEHCYFQLINVPFEQDLPQDTWVQYQLYFKSNASRADNKTWQALDELVEGIYYPNQDTLGFVIKSRLDKILHGSCRKPHHDCPDGLTFADDYLKNHIEELDNWPAVLMLSGDQIYADDVSMPTLIAIHRLIKKLNWKNEPFIQANLADSSQLQQSSEYYNHRELVLPQDKVGGQVKKLLFNSVKKPIFTSDNAHNHLISLDEVLTMYLLVWSPEAWHYTSLTMPDNILAQEQPSYLEQQKRVEAFKSGLHQIRRMMAHLPCAMIFDDHDVTDDWNLTASWEKVAYQNDFSRRILGNALIGYFICQGWGNAPENFPDEFITLTQKIFNRLGKDEHELLIKKLLKFDSWNYAWPTQPKLLVLDTRTQRWQSISKPDKPSGLMDWEALTELQQSLLEHEAVVLVSPAPIFGVKLIEAVQQVFTWFGKPLMVDAENWMAHKGAAYYLLNLFRHPKTPQRFVILSGDVHYSFASKVSLKGRKNSPSVWQITSSGLKNTFPENLLNWLDRLNRWLYAPWSPLNWFTKRKHMRVDPIKPNLASKGERLLNHAGIGLVELDKTGEPIKIAQLIENGQAIEFPLNKSTQDKSK
ncbi:alkaline phosphatase family protein [Catenovulum adriaticum]|uniref:Alkaline phosphatase family protein n=1 Tax=Catenovulum adriaticum TaxID=2984846 RepID=A0ABY7AKM3_9ALTE|nr:alkaline phosphatase family protein [Catenovulum sp. TS8]WAJ69827.1 alkaline phosphatase family protein [Catenovulum sp. TS8]